MVYTIDELREFIEPIAIKYRLRAVYLFGSYARNNATDSSDVDILVDIEGSVIRSMFDMGGLYADLCDNIGREVDLVTTQTLEQKSTQERMPWFVDNLQKEKVKIYEQR